MLRKQSESSILSTISELMTHVPRRRISAPFDPRVETFPYCRTRIPRVWSKGRSTLVDYRVYSFQRVSQWFIRGTILSFEKKRENGKHLAYKKCDVRDKTFPYILFFWKWQESLNIVFMQTLVSRLVLSQVIIKIEKNKKRDTCISCKSSAFLLSFVRKQDV